MPASNLINTILAFLC